MRARTRIRDGHSSGTPVTRRLKQPTRTAGSGHRSRSFDAFAPKPRAVPIRSCSRWGLPCRRRYRRRGALLPHRFTLTVRPEGKTAVCSLWHCPWARARRMLSGTARPWSPDFPPRQPFGFAGAAVRPTDAHRHGGARVPRQERDEKTLNQGTRSGAAMTAEATTAEVLARAAMVRPRPRVAISSCSVLRDDASNTPSTRSGRKWR